MTMGHSFVQVRKVRYSKVTCVTPVGETSGIFHRPKLP